MTATFRGSSVARDVPVSRRVPGGRSAWFQWAIFLATVVLVVGPMLPIAVQSLVDRAIYDLPGAFAPGNYVELFTQGAFLGVIANSLAFAALTSFLAVFLGATFAILTVRVQMPGAGPIGTVLMWPIFISPLVLAFGVIFVYGPSGYLTIAVEEFAGVQPWRLYSLPGMALTAAVAYTPLAYLFCAGSLRQSDPSVEDAVRLSGGGPFQVLRRATLPLMRPPLLYSGLLVFTASVEDLSIPLLYGRPEGIYTFASFLYEHGLATTDPDYGLLGAASMFLLALMVVLILLQFQLLRKARRFVSIRGKASQHRRLGIGRLRWVGFSLACLYLLLGPLLPLIAILTRSFTSILTPLVSPLRVLTWDNYSFILNYPQFGRAVSNSLIIALAGGLLTTLFAGLAVLIVRHSTFRLRRPLEMLALSPQTMPGIVIGIGFFWFFAIIPVLGYVRGTIIAILVAFALRALPTAFGAMAPGAMQVSDELPSSARTMGADWWYAATRILGRLLIPTAFASFALVFVEMMKQYSAALFLVTADSQIIGTLNLQLWINGRTGAVAGLSVIQVAITTIFVVLCSRLFKVRWYA